jgi:nitrate reductase NapE component
LGARSAGCPPTPQVTPEISFKVSAAPIPLCQMAGPYENKSSILQSGGCERGNTMGQDGDHEPRERGRASPPGRNSAERALIISSVLVVLCFLVHILFLLLVEPFKVLHLSKINAYAYSSIPLAAGLIFLFDTISNFRNVQARSMLHLFLFVLAVIFGSLSFHGLLGFILFMMRRSSGPASAFTAFEPGMA